MANVQPSKPVKPGTAHMRMEPAANKAALSKPSVPASKPAAPIAAPKPAAMKMPASPTNGSKPATPAIVTTAAKPDDATIKELASVKKELDTIKAKFQASQEEIARLKNPNAHLSVYHPIDTLTQDSDADPTLANGDWRADLDGQKIALYPASFNGKGEQRVNKDVPPVLHFVSVPRASHPVAPGESADSNLASRYSGFLHVWPFTSKDGASVRGIPDLWRREHVLAAWPDDETSAEPAKEEKKEATILVYFSEDESREMSPTEIITAIEAGEITADSFVWAQDKEDWITVKDSPILSGLLPKPVKKAAPPTKAKK